MGDMTNIIDWDRWREDLNIRAKEFNEASELDRVWYIAGGIVDSAVIIDVWNEDIHEVCNWVMEHGKGLQPKLAKLLIDKNT